MARKYHPKETAEELETRNEDVEAVEEDVPEVAEEPVQEVVKEEPKVKEKRKPAKKKTLTHVSVFLETAKVRYSMNNMQVSGFKARMRGKEYQYDEQVFEDELKKYLNK